jgi:Winged helix DNA-binding domain
MTSLPITRLRLGNQLIANSPFHSVVEVVSRLGAVQAQDYPSAKWAVGQRAQDLDDAAVEQAYNDGAILRTHVLRPTWHFVTPADIRWMLALTAPRVKAASAYYFRRQGLDQSVFSQANSVLEKALQGGKQLTRTELEPFLEQAGLISASDASLRFINIIINAELDGIICSGVNRGAQHTYALLEERVPGAPVLQREEALAELALRYFTSRAPATLKDFIWWSGLSGEQAKEGLALIREQLVEEKVDGQSYWLNPSSPPADEEISPAVHLLPNYDEYIVGYANRSAIYDPANVKKVDERGNFLFNHTIVIDGQVVGTWKRTFKKKAVEITPNPFIALSAAQAEALNAEMGRYSQFLGIPMVEMVS